VKFVEPSHFTDPETAARKLVEIANTSEAVQDGRVFIEMINGPFLKEGGTPEQYRAALASAIKLGSSRYIGLGSRVPLRSSCQDARYCV
jgi:hypothetical protein